MCRHYDGGVLACIVYWPCVDVWGIIACSAVCCCSSLSVNVRGCVRLSVLLPSKACINRFPNHVTDSEWKIQTSSFGVQLCGHSWKHRHMTVLSNQVLETIYLIFYWFVRKFMFLWFRSVLCVGVFFFFCFFFFYLFVLSLWVVEYRNLYLMLSIMQANRQWRERKGEPYSAHPRKIICFPHTRECDVN